MPGIATSGPNARMDSKATSKGNKAQEGQANGRAHNAFDGTDCPAEQGLGGPIPRRYDPNGEAGNGVITKVADRRRRKVRGGKVERRRPTAAGKENPSGGMKVDAGTCPFGDQQGIIAAMRRFLGLANHRTNRHQNASNPMIGCRAQQTCKSSSGTNRRGREKRRGRHARDAAAALWKVATPSTNGRWMMVSMKGRRSESSDESQERQSARVDWGRWTERMATSSRSREERSP